MDPSPALHSPLAAADARHRSASSLRNACLVALFAAPISVIAQPGGAVGDGYFFRRPTVSLTIRGGLDRPTASSDIWAFTTRNLTVDRGDFLAPGYQVDLGIRFNRRTEVVFASGLSVRSTGSEFRDFIDNNDQPIEQTTRIRRLPVTAGVRFALTLPEEKLGRLAWVPARFTPWIGAGGGAMNYTFSQKGDFVDFQTLNVFRQEYVASGWTPMGYANVGADLRLSTRLWLTGDLRYSMARAPMNTPGSKFVGFNKIDLSGTAATMGFTVRM
jgi:hypothetical protein